MSNIVMNIGSNTTKKTQDLERWKDLDTASVQNFNHKYVEPVELSNYVRWLLTEKGTLVTDSNQLSHFLTEDSVINPYSQHNEMTALAVCISGGYDAAVDLYRQYMDPYRWRISKLVNVKAVQNSIHNIFTWTPGERIINPEFGNRLKIYLYEGITDYNVDQIVSEINSCVSKWEPRVRITDIDYDENVDDVEDNTVHLIIKYVIPELSDEEFSCSFSYERGK